MGIALVTDLYELNMAASYLRRHMVGPATFSLFVRKLPPGRGFLVAAGLEDCISHLASLRFEDADLAWLRGAGFDDDALEGFHELRFTGELWAVPEGHVVLANEPILEVTAPIAEAQLVESALVNHVTFQSAVATKAARCRLAAPGIALVDFALRRTHGIEAAMAVARLSAIAGFVATSNVEAARRFGLQAAGTMAHSYVEAFTDEVEAFRAFAQQFPDRTTFLVDTYDTLTGVRAAIAVIGELGLRSGLGIRLDSGDLVGLSRAARRLLDDAGLGDVAIFVSGGLDEHDLARFAAEAAPIDAAGIGTQLGVSGDAPSLDSAYKLVAYGDRPVMKLSANKATLPGAKQVWRAGSPAADVLALRGESGPVGHEPLLVPVMQGGERIGAPEPIDAIAARLASDLATLPPRARDLLEPAAPTVTVSDELAALTREISSHHRPSS